MKWNPHNSPTSYYKLQQVLAVDDFYEVSPTYNHPRTPSLRIKDAKNHQAVDDHITSAAEQSKIPSS